MSGEKKGGKIEISLPTPLSTFPRYNDSTTQNQLPIRFFQIFLKKIYNRKSRIEFQFNFIMVVIS